MVILDLYTVVVFFTNPKLFTQIGLQRSVAKGQIKPKSRLALRRFSQTKGMNEFDLFAVKSKKANKSNSSVRFLENLRLANLVFSLF